MKRAKNHAFLLSANKGRSDGTAPMRSAETLPDSGRGRLSAKCQVKEWRGPLAAKRQVKERRGSLAANAR